MSLRNRVKQNWLAFQSLFGGKLGVNIHWFFVALFFFFRLRSLSTPSCI